MWDPPGPGIELVSPALAGRFFTTVPPGKPLGQGFFFKGCDENSLKLDSSDGCTTL